MNISIIIERIIGKLLKQPEISKLIKQQSTYAVTLSKNVENFLRENSIIEFLKEKSLLVYQELLKTIEEDEANPTINNLGVDFLFNVIYACVKEHLNESSVPSETVQNTSMNNWRIYANNVLARNRELSTSYERCAGTSWIEANNNKKFYDNWQGGIYCPIEIDANMRSFRWESAVKSALSSVSSYCSGMKQEEKWDELIEAYLHYTKEIREPSRISRDLSSNIDKASYSLEQLTQMGEIGLSYFFQFCQTDYSGPSEYKFKRNLDASLRLLNGIFDLRGSAYQKKTVFTDYLVRQLTAFYQKEKNPLFENLRLILPDSNDDQSKTIIKLFQLINEYNYPALATIKLYNFNDEFHKKLLDEFHKYAKEFSCKIQVTISELDKFDSDRYKVWNQSDSWGKYRAVQNLVLKNRRDTRKLSLATNQAPVDSTINDQDITWPLNSNIKPSISIQQQQQQQQQQSKIQEYQADFYFQTADFITRDTIEERRRSRWNRLSKEIKKFSGHADEDDLSKLFDRWVSGINIAGECIQWIEPEAIDVMMDYAPQFRFGLPSESSLPVGFSVKKHPREEGLVLCCDKIKQKPLDIRKREETDKEKRNPFSLKLKNQMAAVFWEGDCRQLFEFITSNEEGASLLSKLEKALMLWVALAITEVTSDKQKEYIKNFFTKIIEKNYLGKGSSCYKFSTDDTQNYLLQLQAYSLSSELITQTPPDACELLKNWSGNYTDSLNNKVFNSKFSEYFFNATTLSAENLKALGQLFYQQGVGQLPDRELKQFGSGILAFLYLAQSIFNENEEFFKIWKKTFVDPSENLSELVAASQLRALSDYFMTFQVQNNSYLQNIFWTMVDKQGQTTPYNHFACLWKPFKSLMCYLNKYELTLNQEVVGAFLKKSIDFQLPIFIERLILTLEKFSDEPLKQRQILAELASYNWHDKIPYNDYYPDEVISRPIEKSLLSKKDYRVLKPREVDACIQLIKPKLSKVNYDNKVTLLTDFYSKQLTVPLKAESTQIQQLLSAFEKLFLCLDKTQYSNDLTQLMAVLKGTEKTKLYARYAAPYLLFVLRAYLPSKEKREDKSSFYLTSDLNDYLTRELTHQQTSSLLIDDRLKNQISSHQEKIEGYLSIINQLALKQHHKEQLITIILASVNTPDKLNTFFNLLKNNQSHLLGNQFYCNLVLLACKESVYKNRDIKKIEDLLNKFHIFSKLFQEKRPYLGHGSNEWVWYKKITSAYQDSLHHLYEKSLLEEDPIKFWVEHPILQTIPTSPTSTIEEVNRYLAMWTIQLALSPLGTCNRLNKQLCQMDAATIKKLGKYVIDHAHRSSEFYQFLLNSEPTDNIIHEFEIGEKHKRFYRVDKKKINSMLANFKYKGGNGFDEERQQELLSLFNETEKFSKDKTLDSLSLEDLHKLIWRYGENCLAKELQDNPENKENKAHLLAVMREILFRKTSKWLNCTQLLVCLDSATSNKNHNQLYQVKTGEGKSILMAMRAAFLALSGQTVDILSSKEDLVQRDQLEFSMVFEALGLRSNYVNQYSKPTDYLAKVRKFGSINYATIGGLSLFRARCEWEKNAPIYNAIYPKSNERIALLDEADHILLDEKTQFNFSINNNGEETWVYQIVSDFFDEHEKQLKEGISRNKHLKPLIQKIMAAYPHSPKQSNFVTLYHLKEPTQETYLKLKALLCAAAQATYLKKDIDFCITTNNKELHGKMVTERVATILINNQVQKGAIYSDGVHQFLHLRLNKEALLLGDVPNFPIASETQLAVSQNVRQVLAQHYAKIEGFTGTAGDKKERDYLKTNYSLARIIKIPPDKISRSQSLPTIFANDETQQIQAICEAITTSREQPLLIVCQDDAEASKIHEKVVQTLAQDNTKNDVIAKIRLDLNSQNKKESDLLDEAGRMGSVTFSARMGRGTDIKPKTDKGLKVIRTYLAAKRITKQERGRQGRNGQVGTHQDILNWSLIEKEYQKYERWDQKLVQDTIKKQTEKLKKRYSNSENFDKVVKMFVIMECQRELKNGLEYIERAKDNFIAMLSMACHKNLANVDANDEEAKHSARFTQCGTHYRDRVIKFHKEVNMKWEETGVEKFKFFVDQVKCTWKNIFPDFPFPEMPSELSESSLHEDGINKSSTPNKVGMQMPDIIERSGGSPTVLVDNRTAQASGYSPTVKEKSENVVSEGMINILQNENTKNLIAKLEEYSKKLAGYSSSLAQAKSRSLFKITSKSSKLDAQTKSIRKIIDEEKATLSKHRHSSVFNCFFNLFFKPTTLANRITSLKLVNELDELLKNEEQKNNIMDSRTSTKL
jgi:preprotein translocase subunit SecA